VTMLRLGQQARAQIQRILARWRRPHATALRLQPV
jgi:hypothetical protein